MPHIHLLLSSNVSELHEIESILRALVEKLAEFETVQSASIKAYPSVFDKFAMGDGAGPGFVHCTVSVLAGRSLELRRSISDGMFETLRECFQESDRRGFSFTLELREMQRETYRKRP